MSMIEVERPENKIAILKLNRPEKLNALNLEVLRELNRVVEELEKDSEILCVIITGEGRAFCAGADIDQMLDMDPIEAMEFSETGQNILSKIENSKKVYIAAINGYALGGGCEIAMACDIRVMQRGAKIGQPEINLGIIPGFGGTQRLPRLVGVGKAKELILTGRTLGEEEALRIGLVEEIAENALERAMEIAREISKKGPISLYYAKELVNKSLFQDLSTALEMERIFFSNLFSTEDQKEGMRAFLEKREPKFKGK